MGRCVHVDLDGRGYDIHIGTGWPAGVSLEANGRGALVVTDSNVGPLYGGAQVARLRSAGWIVGEVTVPAGEGSKTLDQVRRVYEAGFAAGLDRRSAMVALGGGVVGDLTGFAAATFLRGIRFFQLPTTLLAMVDSSVGGKTGVDVPQGKNLVGAFHQPSMVVADLGTLSTLPAREYASGLAEVVKYGVIWDAPFLDFLERHAEAILQHDAGVLESVVARCCEIKAEVVAMDEREEGVRAILNFGHTLGHALEKALGFAGLLHGEAVAIGMAFAGRVSVLEKGLNEDYCERLVQLLRRFGLPVHPFDGGREIAWSELRDAMKADKKSHGGSPRFVLAERPGGVIFGGEVSESVLERAWASVLTLPRRR